ncbi:histidine phosphatase family protein [Paenibacillus pinistramenti]|uniref:histidine phosphatase family protein n=1 Tax=Paenibacillus pinistramenti TaxID=1768003 RepID=UPI001109A4CB|nr:histidine phosphatase family protein [Paenibacillus pinistramenti]
METTLYFVRHADSPYVEGQERARGLSERGRRDALTVSDLLENEGIDILISSPYERAIQTIAPLAARLNQDIRSIEDLRERRMGRFEPLNFQDAKQKLFGQPDFAYADGESSVEAQSRAGNELKRLLAEYSGKKIVIATHGDIMTLMMNLFDSNYGYEFWASTTMPDIYKFVWNGQQLREAARLWTSRG